MAGSFSAAAPERPDHRQAAVAYVVLGAASAAALVAVGIPLGPSDPNSPAA